MHEEVTVLQAGLRKAAVLEAEQNCTATSATRSSSKQSIYIGMKGPIRKRGHLIARLVTNISAASKSPVRYPLQLKEDG